MTNMDVARRMGRGTSNSERVGFASGSVRPPAAMNMGPHVIAPRLLGLYASAGRLARSNIAYDSRRYPDAPSRPSRTVGGLLARLRGGSDAGGYSGLLTLPMTTIWLATAPHADHLSAAAIVQARSAVLGPERRYMADAPR